MKDDLLIGILNNLSMRFLPSNQQQDFVNEAYSLLKPLVRSRKDKQSFYSCEQLPDGCYRITRLDGSIQERISFIVTEKEYLIDKKRRDRLAKRCGTEERMQTPLGRLQRQQFECGCCRI